jgi:ADP-ribose pyrophosphatase YjhB (NUDIX family)
MIKKEKNSIIICKNCNSIGHIYRECPHPISSYGIIVYKIINNISYYLMIQRKNSLSFMEFIKGNYKPTDINNIKSLIESMTIEEQNLLNSTNFDHIWEKIWLQSNNKNTKEYIEAKTNFDILIKKNTLKSILKNNIKHINEPEWGFPKGRKKQNETDIECSLREFTEETQFKNNEIIIKNIETYIEIFFGTNNIMYKHTYYIANFINEILNPKFNNNCIQQIREIRAIKWMTFYEVLNHINQYNNERIEIIKNIDIKIKNM